MGKRRLLKQMAMRRTGKFEGLHWSMRETLRKPNLGLPTAPELHRRILHRNFATRCIKRTGIHCVPVEVSCPTQALRAITQHT